jgi:hypothetical protein
MLSKEYKLYYSKGMECTFLWINLSVRRMKMVKIIFSLPSQENQMNQVYSFFKESVIIMNIILNKIPASSSNISKHVNFINSY